MAVETVDVDALFTPSAHVEFHEFEEDVPLVPGVDAIGHAAVAEDGSLTIAGLGRGKYWAVIDANPAIIVRVAGKKVTRVTEGARRKPRPLQNSDTTDGPHPDRELADTLVDGDPKSAEAPLVTLTDDPVFVVGPRTSANTRLAPSAVERAKAKLTRRTGKKASKSTPKAAKRSTREKGK